jgi:hypothetical protein
MRYDVEPDEVRALARGLRRVQAAVEDLARLDRDGRGLTAAVGSPVVAGGLAEVSRDWSAARRRIVHELAGLADRAEAAAATYDAVEDAVAAGAR